MFLFCWIPLSLFLGNSFAQTIQPLSSERHIFKGDNVTLSCNYTGTVYSLQWYRQYVGSRPEHLILVNENSEAPEPSLRLSAKDSKKQVNLTIYFAEVTDSALYYCALRPTVTGGALQSDVTQQIRLKLNETDSSGIGPRFQWYRQYPRSRPEYLIFNAETSLSSEPTLRLKAYAKKEITEVKLEISSTEVKDSAVYYCALVPTVTGTPPALYKNLIH
ncbi:hypothetical protein QQF64_015162 [Cirrhinus molitorella]|uniref:Ig-like domain-containing protein n=1 Tax=Cirrhinus molitorella TaxID=172907 RepID=A0ABR3NU47_9TELE